MGFRVLYFCTSFESSQIPLQQKDYGNGGDQKRAKKQQQIEPSLITPTSHSQLMPYKIKTKTNVLRTVTDYSALSG